jgi:hypothetical protein
MRQGLAFPCLGVFNTKDFVGDVNCDTSSDMRTRRVWFCFDGELEFSACLGRALLGV